MTETDETGPITIHEGEWAGWSTWRTDAFETLAGPFYFRRQDDGSVRCAFRAEPKHRNGGGALHGGSLLTFADFCLFALSHEQRRAKGDTDHYVTVSLNADFAGAAVSGDLVEATGEVVRAGGSLMFVRGLITVADVPKLAFSGVIKRIRAR